VFYILFEAIQELEYIIASIVVRHERPILLPAVPRIIAENLRMCKRFA